MIITGHTAAAAVIVFLAIRLRWRWSFIWPVILVGAFLSHFLMDFVPHWNYDAPTGFDASFLPVLADAGVALVLWFIYFGFRHGWRAWVGIFAFAGFLAILPDIRFGLAMVYGWDLFWFDNFHQSVQIFGVLDPFFGNVAHFALIGLAFMLSRGRRVFFGQNKDVDKNMNV